jgi:hypothetical protein
MPCRLLLCLLLLVSPSLWASSTLRCGSGLVSSGDTTGEVISTCGEPISRDFLGYRVVTGYYGERNEVAVEEWVYGPRSGMYHFLRFEGGRLTSVTSKRKQ